MPKGLIRFFRQHTPAGRYIHDVEYGSAIQQDRVRELSAEPEFRERLSRVFEINHASARISELFQGRY